MINLKKRKIYQVYLNAWYFFQKQLTIQLLMNIYADSIILIFDIT